MSMRRRGIGRLARRKAERRLGVLGCIGYYFVSRCKVWRRKNGLYFFFSSRFGVRGLFLFRVVMYRETGLPSAFASVHSRITISCGIWDHSFASVGAASSSSVSPPSSSVSPNKEVTDWRIREALLCFSNCDWHSTVKRAKGIASSRARGICLPDISHFPYVPNSTLLRA